MNNPTSRPQGIPNKYNKVIARQSRSKFGDSSLRSEQAPQSLKKRLPRYARNDCGNPVARPQENYNLKVFIAYFKKIIYLYSIVII
jgi:hypothetical protein